MSFRKRTLANTQSAQQRHEEDVNTVVSAQARALGADVPMWSRQDSSRDHDDVGVQTDWENVEDPAVLRVRILVSSCFLLTLEVNS